MFNPGDGVFSLRRALPVSNSCSTEASRHFTKSLIKTPRRELMAFQSSHGSDGNHGMRAPGPLGREAGTMCCVFLSSRCEVAVVLAVSHRAGGMGKGRNWEHRDGFNMYILVLRFGCISLLTWRGFPFLQCFHKPRQDRGGCSAPVCGPEYGI